MKKIFLSILFALSFFLSFGQGIINRSTPSVTASDARLQAALNLYVPRFSDTTSANNSIGIDSCGAVIFTYNVNWYWIRQCSPKRWSMLPTVNGSLISNVYIVDSNHIAICTFNGCDTIQINGIQGPITNITIINNTSIRVCGSDILGDNVLTNGAFTGSAAGWTLGALWAYGSNDIGHSFGSTATSFQGGGLVEGGSYFVELDVNGGAAGSVIVSLDAGTSQSYGFNAGSVSFTGTWNAGINSKINFAPTNDFDGNITNVSVRQLLPNCDTLQIVPTNFIDSIRIYVKTPLVAVNDSTFAIRQAGLQDSGYLAKGGYDTFYHKVDSLTHFAQNNIDFLQFVKNGVVTNWDTVHVTCYGLEEPGQVAWSGFGLDYIVNSAFYRLNCKPYISPSTVLTLAAADATLARIDLIYVDSSGNAGVLTGTPAINPVKPQIDPFWQLELTTITVPATATVAPIDTTIIYDENVEWDVTNSGTTDDPDNTLNVYRGAKSINVTNINVGDSIIFTEGSTFDVSPYSSVVLFIKLKEAIPATSQIRANWLNGSTYVAGTVQLPIDKNNTTTYQNVSIPLSTFSFSSTLVTAFKLSYSASSATVNQGFFLDFIYLQRGVGPVVPTDQTNIVAYNGLTHFKVNGIDSIRLGGTLTQTPTTIATGVNTLVVSTATASINPFSVTSASGIAINSNSATGTAVNALSNGSLATLIVSNTSTGTAIRGTSVSNAAIQGISTGGSAIVGTSVSSLAGEFIIDPASTNTSIETVRTARTTSGTAAAGIGSYIGTFIENGSGILTEASRAVTSLTTVTNGSEVSSYSISLRNAAAIAQKLLLSGSGQLRLNAYGIATFTGTPAYNLAVDASGNLIEVSPAGGVSANNGLNISSGSNVQIGGTLLQNTTVTTGTFRLTLSGTSTANPLRVDATTGIAIIATTTGAGNAIQAQSTNGVTIGAFREATANNTVVPVVTVRRDHASAGADGIGGSIEFSSMTASGTTGIISNTLSSKWTTATEASRVSQFIISGVNNAVTGDIISFEGNKRTMLYGRLQPQQGADVASAAGAIAVGLDGNVFELTGTAAVTLISNLNWVNGSEITLVFTSTATLTNGTATSGTDITILLAGATNFTGSANDVIKLVLSEVGGTQAWREVSRSVN